MRRPMLPLGLLLASLAIPAAAPGATDPLVACQGRKLKVAGKHAAKVAGCFSKSARRAPAFSPSTLEDALSGCGAAQRDALATAFARADAKAAKKGEEACAGPTPDAVADVVEDALERALFLGLAGVETPDDGATTKATHKLLASLLKGTGKYARKWLGAELKARRSGDAAKRRAARLRARDRWERGWSKASLRSTGAGAPFDFDPPGRDVDDDLQVVVAMIFFSPAISLQRHPVAQVLPPIFVNPIAPIGGSEVRIGVDLPGATFISMTATGAGCGTLVGGSVAGDFFFEDGSVGAFGHCALRAQVAAPGGSLDLTRDFDVIATSLPLPDIRLVDGIFVPGPLPAGDGGPAIAAIEGPATLVSGSAARFRVRLQDPALAREVRGVAVQVGAGAAGHYEARAFVAGEEILIELELAPSDVPAGGALVPRGVLSDFLVALRDRLGRVGAAFGASVDTLQVGAGNDVEVSVSWETPTDVDLHVVEPGGEEIYWGNTTSATGGSLSVDSNAGCSIDGIENEKVTWPAGMAPPGEYEVRVDFWSDCDAAGADYTVTASFCGQSQTETGTFQQGTSTGGGLGAGRHVFDFFVDCAYRVRGTARFEDRAISETSIAILPRPVPIRFARLEIVRESDGAVLAEGETRQDGTFDVRFANDGPAGFRVRVLADADSDQVKHTVVNAAGAVYAVESEVFDEVANPDRTDVELLALEEEAGPAFNIFDAGVSGSLFNWTVLSRAVPHLTWEWTLGDDVDCGAPPSSCYYGSRVEVNSLPGERDGYDDPVLLHEMGHHWEGIFSAERSPAGNHSFEDQVDPLLAWSEGQATFFGLSVFGAPTYVDTDGEVVTGSYHIDLPDPLDIPFGTVGNVDTGALSEGVVAAILWDLADDGQETRDTVARRDSTFSAFRYLQSDDFADRGVEGPDLVDYLDGWFCLGFGERGDLDSGVQGILENVGVIGYDFVGPTGCSD